MAFTLGDVRTSILALVVGALLVIVGAIGGDITTSVGNYIITTLTNTGNFTQTTHFLDSVSNIVGPVFTITGVVLIVMASIFILKELLQLVTKDLVSST